MLTMAENETEASDKDDHRSDEEIPSLDKDAEHPWPYLHSLFDCVGVKSDSFRMKCMLCTPKLVEILAYKNSPSNLRKHVKRMHPESLAKYSALTSVKRKRAAETSTQVQSTLRTQWSIFPQGSLDKAVMKYIITGLQPFSLLEQESFKIFVKDLIPNSRLMTRVKLRAMTIEAATKMKKALTDKMGEVAHIATTTDCWTVRRRGFIGVTAHWINEDLNRCSVALACRQLKGSHTFDQIAAALNDIHTEYDIREKIVRTTTDSGSNFIKAFKVYAEETESTSESEEREDHTDEESGDDVEVENVDVADLLSQDDGMEFQLPRHQRCACHLINRIVMADALDAKSNDTYKKVYRSAFSKCHALWNKCGRSTLAAEAVEDSCTIQILRPNTTRWNSLFLAVERLLRIIKDKGEGTIRNLCNDFKVPMFNPAELAFLGEYAIVMTPVAQATNILQAETNAQMGWLLPTITLLSVKLDRVKLQLKYCRPLVDALQEGIKTRFGTMAKDPELIAAAILLPKFRTTWTKEEATIKMGMDYIKQHIEQSSPSEQSRASSSDDEDFFSPLQSSHSQDSSKQLDAYLTCSADHMTVLKSYPAVCALSVKLNTPLPASAACERLFSIAGLVFAPRRARLNSKNFENQLLLRMNRKFLNW
ncbi:uncharacterized protein LOC127537594 isoform X1 [Acanthochromis polyacanthus]|uniref:uncharacterized protein LOC127533004 n=1 Tax=Acanthochromis polyacanthus TaxID=80966 RepID=UPI002234246E|nr:uncharacterized protein LOC127533004 [Acanthochromis polyacanthus]XP_051802906.1 uncharacterized protein LOC127533588 isoform X1 [Acanthochromis polyacanthus]XP_051810437.1 uncharacterized protein LOC110949270 isoform X1 [Acanthochromis polyacanthus]XP_051812380.1 uncharacterized protein LOC127536371 isoform X1 [Acanthochromis polyacanthus]XP_051816232.1 uncharacterized protein LOC127537594 isoform X1 [Acanthochromis polyacanthus]